MATKSKSITIKFERPDEKKKVVRYFASKEDDPISSIYVDKAALAKLGNPEELTVTLEA